MRRLIAIISVLMLVAITAPTTNALPLNRQMQVHYSEDNLPLLTIQLPLRRTGDMPVIVEEYTATWCSNCVDVEMAIKNIADQENIKSTCSTGQLVRHKILWTDELDERWESRYDRRAPPTAVLMELK